MSARVRIRAALCLALALANSGPALADSKVYRWTDDLGRVHITATPPPEGAHLAPAETPPATPAAPAEVLPDAVEPGPASPATPPAARAPEADVDPCAAHSAEIAAWLAAERKLAPLEAAIERIEADPVLGSATETCPRYSPCTYSSFTREEAARQAREELREAEAKLADAEERAHQTGTPDRCLFDPNE